MKTFIVGLLLGCGVGALAMRLTDRPQPAPEAAPYAVEQDQVKLLPGALQPMRFTTAQTTRGEPLPRPPVTGRVITIESRTSPSFSPLGGRVERSAVALGDKVRVGQRLVLIRSGDLASMLKDLKAEQLSVQTRRSMVERLRILVESRAASDNDLTVAQHQLEEAELAAKAAQARLRSLAVAEDGDNLFWLLATRAGTVVQLDASPGLEVAPAKERPVVTIADLNEVLVEADVRQQDALGMAAGNSAAVTLGEQRTVTGMIETVAQVVDPARQTVPVRVRLDNAGHQLRPNAFVEVVFSDAPTAAVLRVPSEAVVSDGTKTVVFVETQKGAFERRQVVVGRQARGLTEVLSGLGDGEAVVTRGALLLLNALDIEG